MKMWKKSIDEEGGQRAVIGIHTTDGENLETMVEYVEVGKGIYIR